MLQSIRSQGVGHDFSTETTIKTADGIQEQRPELLGHTSQEEVENMDVYFQKQLLEQEESKCSL